MVGATNEGCLFAHVSAHGATMALSLVEQDLAGNLKELLLQHCSRSKAFDFPEHLHTLAFKIPHLVPYAPFVNAVLQCFPQGRLPRNRAAKLLHEADLQAGGQLSRQAPGRLQAIWAVRQGRVLAAMTSTVRAAWRQQKQRSRYPEIQALKDLMNQNSLEAEGEGGDQLHEESAASQPAILDEELALSMASWAGCLDGNLDMDKLWDAWQTWNEEAADAALPPLEDDDNIVCHDSGSDSGISSQPPFDGDAQQPEVEEEDHEEGGSELQEDVDQLSNPAKVEKLVWSDEDVDKTPLAGNLARPLCETPPKTICADQLAGKKKATKRDKVKKHHTKVSAQKPTHASKAGCTPEAAASAPAGCVGDRFPDIILNLPPEIRPSTKAAGKYSYTFHFEGKKVECLCRERKFFYRNKTSGNISMGFGPTSGRTPAEAWEEMRRQLLNVNTPSP